MLRRLQQDFRPRQRFGFRFMRMNPDRTMDVGRALGYGEHARELRQLGADGEEVAHAGRPRARQHRIELGCELRKIEMAVAVDEHEEQN